MNGRPFLVEIGRPLKNVAFEAVRTGNAAAALQGAPGTTVDFDFMFRKSPRNLRRLKAFAKASTATPVVAGFELSAEGFGCLRAAPSYIRPRQSRTKSLTSQLSRGVLASCQIKNRDGVFHDLRTKQVCEPNREYE